MAKTGRDGEAGGKWWQSEAMREEILELGRAAGLAECGILPVGPSPRAAALQSWMDRGAHAGMDWMAATAARRADPSTYWTWARTALIGAVDYFTLPWLREQAPGLGALVSRYARGVDYHPEVKARLRRWGDLIEKQRGPFHRRSLCDTSGILERDLAARAGLGWIGKNTCLIGPRGNSWRFLGVLLTDLELPATGPGPEALCGECRACLDACPTGALTQPWFLDSRRCLSYLNIEHRGPIDSTLAGLMGDWLFGCDICQEVCPWNGKVEPLAEGPFATAPHLAGLDLGGLLRLDRPAFHRRFRRTLFQRPGWRGILRNALIVGSHLGEGEARKAAERFGENEDAGLREAARYALDRG